MKIKLDNKMKNILLACCIACFVSCRNVKYIPVESVRTETEYVDRLKRDSIHVLDSVFMLVKGDTVFRDRWRIEYRNLYVKDTINLQVRDTIRVPYPVEVVKNKVPGVMWWLVIILAALGLPSVIKLLRKFKIVPI